MSKKRHTVRSPTDYDRIAPTYAQSRWTLSWHLSPLHESITALPERSVIIDIGCSTGDYTSAVASEYPAHRVLGFDISREMLRFALQKRSDVLYSVAELMFCINVMHHLTNIADFFTEAHRGLKKGGLLLIFTDSEKDIRKRSTAKYFPETVEPNLERYPPIPELVRQAETAGFTKTNQRVNQVR